VSNYKNTGDRKIAPDNGFSDRNIINEKYVSKIPGP